ncbi:MAG: YraN family protein [Deltaproteobacteria bacterium]|nr:YraN family protein [Deltaproteobacteria bacterium]
MPALKKRDNRKWGKEVEKKAASFLKKNGLKIVTCNFYTCFGEIDIIAKDKEEWIFVEVKGRKNEDFGLPQEAVNQKKQKKIKNVALLFLQKMRLNTENTAMRFDIISFLENEGINWIKNAY